MAAGLLPAVSISTPDSIILLAVEGTLKGPCTIGRDRRGSRTDPVDRLAGEHQATRARYCQGVTSEWWGGGLDMQPRLNS